MKKFRWFGIWLQCSLCVLGLAACSIRSHEGSSRDGELVIFAATSLTDAFLEIGEVFETQNPGVNLVLNFASSSQLATQLREGVTADVFASANPKQMQVVVGLGRVAPENVLLFAANSLTVIVPAGNPALIYSLEDLAKPDVILLMAAQGVPVREYADQIIDKLPQEMQAQIYANLISEESNVRQVVTKIALGEADAGFVYASDVTADIASQVEQIRIPDNLNVTAEYPLSVIADSQQKNLAQEFIRFVRSDAGQAILADWGFLPFQTTDMKTQAAQN
jgi:molybdate transport system substrate-binding protein